jgi:hypothetical protein
MVAELGQHILAEQDQLDEQNKPDEPDKSQTKMMALLKILSDSPGQP